MVSGSLPSWWKKEKGTDAGKMGPDSCVTRPLWLSQLCSQASLASEQNRLNLQTAGISQHRQAGAVQRLEGEQAAALILWF